MANIKREELSGNFLEAFDKIVKLKNSDDAKQREAGLKGEKTLKKLLESKKGQSVKKVVKPKAKATPKKAKATPKKAKATPKKAKATPKKAKATPKKVSVTETNPKGLPFATRVKQRADKDGITFKEARAKLSKEIQDEKDKIEAKLREDKKKALKELEKITKAPEFQQALSQFPKKSSGKKRALKSNVSADGKRQALPRGKRISQGKGANQYGKAKKGKVYYEYRDNRSDVNSVPTKAGQYKYKGKTPPYLEAGGTLPTPFGQAGLVAETGTMNEVDLFAMGGGLPQGVHQYYGQTYNPAYPTPHGYAKGGFMEEDTVLIEKSQSGFYMVYLFNDKYSDNTDYGTSFMKRFETLKEAKSFANKTAKENNATIKMAKGGDLERFRKTRQHDIYFDFTEFDKIDSAGRTQRRYEHPPLSYETTMKMLDEFKKQPKKYFVVESKKNDDGFIVYKKLKEDRRKKVMQFRASQSGLYAKGGEIKKINAILEKIEDGQRFGLSRYHNARKLKDGSYNITTSPKNEDEGDLSKGIRRKEYKDYTKFKNAVIRILKSPTSRIDSKYAKGGALNSLKKQMNDNLDIHSEYYAEGGEVAKEIYDTFSEYLKVAKVGDIIWRGGNIDDFKYVSEYNVEKVVKVGQDSVFVKNIGDEDKMAYESPNENSPSSIYSLKTIVVDGTKYAKGGMIEIDEYGSNIPSKLQEVFDQFNEDEDSYKEMERLRLKAQEVGYDFDYDLSGEPTEFMKINKMAKGGNVTAREKLEKELHKLQRDLNSSRLNTFIEGDNSDEEKQRQRERASKLRRFNEVLEVLNEIDAKGNKMAKGGRTISIVNDGVKYDKSKYKAVYGDYDKDGVVNIDDANPLNKNKKGKVEEIELKNTFDKLLGVKAELDEIMYDAVDTLDEKAPKGADIYARTKTPYSILKKLVEKRMLDPKRGLTDMIGTTIAVENQKELVELRDKIDNGLLGKVLDRDDFYKRPNAGYRAYHYIVEYKGVPVEVQLKTKNMKKLHEVAHKSYKLGNLNPKTLNEVSIVFMKADKGDAKSKVQMEKLLSNKKQLISKISK